MTFLEIPWLRRLLPVAIISMVAAAFFTPILAQADNGSASIDFFTITMKLFGGLAIFLYGMERMGDALKIVAGEKMKQILGTLTTNRVMGLITGAIVTAIIQSSSVTTVLLVGFVTADLMSLSQAIGVILGADIGTTITAQIVAFKVTKFASLLIAVGFVQIFTAKDEKKKQYGYLVMGLGMIFFGMGEMSNAMKPLRSYEPFIDMMRSVDNPVIGILISAAFTGLIQSSSATMGVIVALAMQGLISLEGGIALAFGANIGTCMTAGLAAMGKPRAAVRVAVAHVTFKIAGVAIAVWFIPQLADLCRDISPQYADLLGQDRLAAEVPRQVANAHTIFNVVMAFGFLPIGGLFVRWCEWVVPNRPESESVEEAMAGISYSPKYLDEALISTPSLALSLVRREVNVMSDILERMLAGIPDAVFKGDLDKMKEIAKMDDRVDEIHQAVTTYLAKIGSGNLPASVADEVMATITATSEMENIGDIIENNLSHLAEVCANSKVDLSSEAIQTLTDYHAKIFSAFNASATAFITDNEETALAVMSMKDEISHMDSVCQNRQMDALQRNEDSPMADLAAYTLQMDIRENLKRIYYHTKRVAKVVARSKEAVMAAAKMRS
ncbi:MAG: Na/Pi cotransporter family protein [Magnetococcales bacterium]|nr:Na/Pi cotransporter family protein [Magnetococcales bacterium]